jgi:hypothetical protein
MTSAVTDGEKDRFVLDLGFAEGSFIPGEPMDGVVGVLEEIG